MNNIVYKQIYKYFPNLFLTGGECKMNLRKFLALLLAVVLCVTVAFSVISCGDDDAETTAEETVAPEGEGEVVEGEGGEEVLEEVPAE